MQEISRIVLPQANCKNKSFVKFILIKGLDVSHSCFHTCLNVFMHLCIHKLRAQKRKKERKTFEAFETTNPSQGFFCTTLTSVKSPFKHVLLF